MEAQISVYAKAGSPVTGVVFALKKEHRSMKHGAPISAMALAPLPQVAAVERLCRDDGRGARP